MTVKEKQRKIKQAAIDNAFTNIHNFHEKLAECIANLAQAQHYLIQLQELGLYKVLADKYNTQNMRNLSDTSIAEWLELDSRGKWTFTYTPLSVEDLNQRRNYCLGG